MSEIQKILDELVKKNQERERDERVEVLIRVTSAQYDKAMAYTNLIILAGFAGFFAVWSSMKDHLSSMEMFASALCITISLTAFIFWEVLGMLVRSKSMKAVLLVLNAPPGEFSRAMAKHQNLEQHRNILMFRVWNVILVITVAPALVAAGLLIFSFGRQLWAGI